MNDQIGPAGTATGGPLTWLRMEGCVVFILSILLYGHIGASWWRFLELLLLPDIAMAGYWLGTRWGANVYNLAHSYVVPLMLAGFAIVSARPDWFPYLLIWTAHIAMDRAARYGLKYTSGFKQTHLGSLEKRHAA